MIKDIFLKYFLGTDDTGDDFVVRMELVGIVSEGGKEKVLGEWNFDDPIRLHKAESLPIKRFFGRCMDTEKEEKPKLQLLKGGA